MAESGLGLAALTKNQDAKNKFTVATFPRESVSPRMAAVLDRLAADPIARNIGIVSGPRDTAYNAAVRGAANSQHKYSNALDLGFKGLPETTKSHVLNALVDAGVSRFGLYNSGAFHFDVRPGVGFWGALKGAFTGMTAKQLNLLPEWARSTIAGLVNGTIKPNEEGLPAFEKNLIDNKTEIQASLPYRMDDPRFTPALDMPSPPSPAMQALANAQIAYGASRALNMQPPSLSPPNPGAIRGLNVPSALSRPSTPPSNFSVPERPSPIGSAPVGAVTRAPLGPALARPSPPSNFAQGAPVSYGAPKANRLGGMDYAVAPERFDRPATRVAAGTPTSGYAPKAQPAGTPTAGYNTKAQAAGTPTAGYDVSMPSGISRPAAPSQASIQGALSQAQGKLAADAKAYADFETARAQALSSLPAPAPTVTHPPNPTVGIPAPITAPPAIVAPPPALQAPVPTVISPPPQQLMGPPRENFAYAPPAAKAYDVYSGLADTAFDNTGRNQVSSIPGGTSVTNQYGATTGMVNGYQTAVGSLPGISAPNIGKIGQSVKGAIPSVAGGIGGGLLGGPLGALLGAALGNALKPGGALNNPGGFAARGDAIGGLSASQQANARSLDAQARAKGYDRSNSISPRAQAAIDAGVGGLY